LSNNAKTPDKVKKLLELLRGKRSLLIVMQDNPDPDSIASAASLRRIAHTAGDVQCSITYGGVIGRSENKAVADYLGLNFRPIENIDPTKFDAVALVDTQPRTGNNSLPETVTPDIVIDHHPLQPATRGATFTDVRSKYGALSTILFEYLVEAGITPDPPLATALLYAIRTDTQDLGRKAVQADIRATETLYPLANARMLGEIQRGAVDLDYFRTMATALHEARVQGRCLFVLLDEVPNPDIVAELADMFLRYDGVDWTLCGGFWQDKAWLSLRTSQTAVDAADVIRRIVEGMGTGGGHPMASAGQVPIESNSQAERTRIKGEVRERFLREVGESGERPKKLLRSRAARPKRSPQSV
jgi:nanoRNase/pAp phosphatase (c-di-AMP/oligoRNAs hydrolase)